MRRVMALSLPQAVTLATERAQRTGHRQRVEVCGCDRRGWPPHFMVGDVDRLPEGAL